MCLPFYFYHRTEYPLPGNTADRPGQYLKWNWCVKVSNRIERCQESPTHGPTAIGTYINQPKALLVAYSISLL